MTEKFRTYLFYLSNNIVTPTPHEIHSCILPPREEAMQATNLR